jgi:hypothetical protein
VFLRTPQANGPPFRRRDGGPSPLTIYLRAVSLGNTRVEPHKQLLAHVRTCHEILRLIMRSANDSAGSHTAGHGRGASATPGEPGRPATGALMAPSLAAESHPNSRSSPEFVARGGRVST